MCIWVPPLQKHPDPSFFANFPFNTENRPSPPPPIFRQSLLYIVFYPSKFNFSVNLHKMKKCETKTLIKIFVICLIMDHSLSTTVSAKSMLPSRRLVQFKFLVMIAKNIFVYIFFYHEIFQILVYFLCKNCNSPEKIPLSFPLKMKIHTKH